MSNNEILEDFKEMNKVKDLARRNCLGIIPEDSDYIVNNIEKILFTVYHVFNDYIKLRTALEIVGITTDELREEYHETELLQISQQLSGK